jgi:Tfp pilus assembly protein PilX
MRGYLRRRRGRDAGVTMVAVLAAFTILMVVVLGSLAYLTASTKYSRYEQDTDLALAAAQSGVSDLLSRLRADPDYLSDVAGTKDDPTGYCQAAFTGAPPQSSEGALDGDYFAADCGWTAGTEAKVAEFGAGSAAERFHYMVTYYSPIARSLEVVATGAAGSVVRSIKARIAKDSPEQYLYLSDYEVIDPTDDTAYPDGISSRMCGQGWPEAETMNQLGHRWEIYPNPANKPTRIYIGSDNLARACPEPYFSQFDVLDGRVHSNDTIKSNKAQFLGEFTTRDPRCQAVNPADS